MNQLTYEERTQVCALYLRATSRVTGISEAHLKSRSMEKKAMQARIAMTPAMQRRGYARSVIADALNRDRTTIKAMPQSRAARDVMPAMTTAILLQADALQKVEF